MSELREEEIVRQVVAELRQAIEASALSQRELNERLGWGRGRVSHLLAGEIDLKLLHLVEILGVLEVPVGEFFADLAELFGVDRPVELTERSVAAFEARVKLAVRKELQRVLRRTAGRRRGADSGGESKARGS